MLSILKTAKEKKRIQKKHAFGRTVIIIVFIPYFIRLLPTNQIRGALMRRGCRSAFYLVSTFMAI